MNRHVSMKIKVNKDGFTQSDPKIKTPEQIDRTKIEEIRKMMQDSIDPILTEDQRLDLHIKILRDVDGGFQLLSPAEQDSYKKKYEEFKAGGPP